MAAPKGNNYRMKWKTKKEREEAFALVYDHLAAGYSKESFPYADWDTVERYCKDFPKEFPSEKLAEAMRIQRFEWESIGMDGAKGKIPGFNAASWIFNMKNRFRDEWQDRVVQQNTQELKITGFEVVED